MESQEIKYKAVPLNQKLLKKHFSASEIMASILTMKQDADFGFYVECEGNTSTKYCDRLHITVLKDSYIRIEIDKGADGGTHTKIENISFLSEFFENINGYIRSPKTYGYTYEQW